jgi:hypothetical protein
MRFVIVFSVPSAVAVVLPAGNGLWGAESVLLRRVWWGNGRRVGG